MITSIMLIDFNYKKQPEKMVTIKEPLQNNKAETWQLHAMCHGRLDRRREGENATKDFIGATDKLQKWSRDKDGGARLGGYSAAECLPGTDSTTVKKKDKSHWGRRHKHVIPALGKLLRQAQEGWAGLLSGQPKLKGERQARICSRSLERKREK